jgi:hypothetical protein
MSAAECGLHMAFDYDDVLAASPRNYIKTAYLPVGTWQSGEVVQQNATHGCLLAGSVALLVAR